MRNFDYAMKVDRWATQEEVRRDYMTMILSEILPVKRGQGFDGYKILDFGCNTGPLVTEIMQYYPGAQVTGFDINVDAVTYGNQVYPWLNRCLTCDPKVLKTQKYDLIFMSHVLNHVPYPDETLSKLHDALKCGGCLIMVNPNFWHYALRPKTWMQGDSTVMHHVMFPGNLMEALGFSVEIKMPLGRRNWAGVHNKLLYVARRVSYEDIV